MVDHQVPFFHLALAPLGQAAQHISQIPAQVGVNRRGILTPLGGVIGVGN